MKTEHYVTPSMELIVLASEDIITLSVGADDYDPEIKGENGNPWAQ